MIEKKFYFLCKYRIDRAKIVARFKLLSIGKLAVGFADIILCGICIYIQFFDVIYEYFSHVYAN